MKRGTWFRVLSIVLLVLGLPITAWAQGEEESLHLQLRKSFGFAAGARIQGRFKLIAHGPEDLIRVDFYLDNEQIESVEQSPFEISFSTGDYLPGQHTLLAVGTTDDGGTLRSTEFTYQFLSPDDAQSSTFKIIVPLLIAVALMSVLAGVVPVLLGRGKSSFELGAYGAAGGAVCPRCRLPYSRHFFAPNMLLGKLERCPHCGKWAIVRAAYGRELQDAEERYLADRGQGELQVEEDEAGRMKRMLDDSRFEG